LAQRLVRVICPRCRQPIRPDEKLLQAMGVPPSEKSADIVFFTGEGCQECRDTGFRGRTAIFEYLQVNEDISKEITLGSTTEQIRNMAIQKGMRTLRQDGWRKVMQGITTVSEVLRVTLEK